MKGDFSRNTFDPSRHFLRVLMQQGRALLDADWNEQTSILLHYLQNLAADMIGPHGGPPDILDNTNGLIEVRSGFRIILNPNDETQLYAKEKERLKKIKFLPVDGNGNLVLEEGDFLISKGRYYVGGLLCENHEYSLYSKQALPSSPSLSDENLVFPVLIYLEVWERHITCNENEHIREVALAGPDTANRSQVVCQVKIKGGITNAETVCNDYQAFLKAIDGGKKPGEGKLKARVQPLDENVPVDSCVISPTSRYRGAENQLYRVEIHEPRLKVIDTATGEISHTTATFKWSRENGAVIFPIKEIAFSGEGDATTTTVTLEHLGREARFGLKEGDWVEIVDDDIVLESQVDKLLQVSTIDPVMKQVILDGKPASAVGQDPKKHPLLRRWDSPGEVTIEQPVISEGWIPLEDSIQVMFDLTDEATYEIGDYWLIPARTETGNIDWPTEEVPNDEGEGTKIVPVALPPRGIRHYYAPLAIVQDQGVAPHDCRCEFLDMCQVSKKLDELQQQEGAATITEPAARGKETEKAKKVGAGRTKKNE
ncbi:DUF6519 domain-containing protein [candidate division KSB1 bacterium]|nr:DUF6519 domain-containing protein [candidate division KSB1 bacterium]